MERGPSVVRVLGPIQVLGATGGAIELASASQRRLLAVLAVHAPHAVRAERLAAVLDLSPSGLRTSVTRLRRALGADALVSTAVATSWRHRSTPNASNRRWSTRDG